MTQNIQIRPLDDSNLAMINRGLETLDEVETVVKSLESCGANVDEQRAKLDGLREGLTAIRKAFFGK